MYESPHLWFRFRSSAGAACIRPVRIRGDSALFSEPRRYFDGQDRRSLRGSLRLLLRWMAKEEPRSSGPNVVERLSKALPGQPAVSARHSRRSCRDQDGPQQGDGGDWRFLRGVHGRDRRQQTWRTCHSAATRCDCRISLNERHRFAGRQCYFAVRTDAPVQRRLCAGSR